MSTEIARLTESIIAEPAALEHRLVTAMREAASRILEHPAIKRGLVAAESLPAGLIIADEAKAAEVVDLARTVIEGEKALATEVASVLRIPKQIEAAVKLAVEPRKSFLAAAKQVANDARLAYQADLRRKAAAEEERRRRAAEEQARTAAAQEILTGEEAAPPLEVAPVEVPRIVKTGAAISYTQVRVEPVEIVDDAACPIEWKKLNAAIARAVFLSDVMEKKVAKPGPGESIVWKGVRFDGVEGAVNR